jgi:hypothetical protein
MKKIIPIAILSFLLVTSVAGQNTMGDNALKYNRLLQEKNEEGGYKLIGTYKVVGNPYLFGQKNKGDMFSPDAKAYNISLSYNTYNQEVEFYSSANQDQALVKETGSVDSFLIHENVSIGIMRPLKFVYGSHIHSKDEAYFMELYSGPRYSVYKKYKSDLGYVSANYVQSELRQFDLLFDYYYLDVEKKTLKKLKPNTISITKEFKSVKDITPVFNDADFTVDPENALRKAFAYLNQ